MAAPKRSPKKPDGEEGVLAVIGEMPEPDRSTAEKLHAAIVKQAASD